jgi:diguanylate cyclase (GGDEF)-like protein/PAS domain S-box-containing protein
MNKICENCKYEPSEINFNILKKINPFLIKYKYDILDSWIESKRVSLLLKNINTSNEIFLNKYGLFIFDFFLNFTIEDKNKDKHCVVAFAFLAVIKDYQNCSQIISLICSQLKNSFLEILLKTDVILVLNESERIEIFRSLSCLFDLNLSNIMSEYNSILIKKEKDALNHSKLFEETTIVSKTDINGHITFVSDSFEELSGYKRKELIGRTHSLLKHNDFNPNIYQKLWSKISNGERWTGKLKNLRKDGKEIIFDTTIIPEFDLNGNIKGYMALRNDITDKIKAKIDGLTGIMNKAKFNEELLFSIDDFYINHKNLNLVFIDLDFFKNINDTFGHIVGDKVLIQFTKIVNKNIRPFDTFARWGGEEFVILLKGIDSKTALNAIERIRKDIENFNFEGTGDLTASFGLVSFENKFKSADEFIDMADKCLYHSKNNGRNCISYLENSEIKKYKIGD